MTQGWVCAVCGSSNSPLLLQCGCRRTGASASASVPNADVVALKPRATAKASPKRRSYDDPGFDEFWKHYPLKLDKRKAYGAWLDALAQGAEPQSIIAGAKRYARWCSVQGLEARHIKYPQGWLNGERWNDELPLPKAVGEGPSFAEQEAERQAEYERIKQELA